MQWYYKINWFKHTFKNCFETLKHKLIPLIGEKYLNLINKLTNIISVKTYSLCQKLYLTLSRETCIIEYSYSSTYVACSKLNAKLFKRSQWQNLHESDLIVAWFSNNWLLKLADLRICWLFYGFFCFFFKRKTILKGCHFTSAGSAASGVSNQVWQVS